MDKPVNNSPKELLKGLPLNENSLYLDIGGFVGEYADVVKQYYNCRIKIYEPCRSFADKLVKKGYDVENVAVSERAGTTKIYLDGDATSLFFRWKKSTREETINIIPASDLPASDLLKINCEGAEYHIIDCLAKSGKMKEHNLIIVQFHKFDSSSIMEHHYAQEHLRLTHKLLWSTGMFVWEMWIRK